MPSVAANGMDIYFDTFGDPSDPAVLLVCGLGAQCVGYDDEMCELIAGLGTHLIRYDNRDTGLSTHLHGVEVDPLGAIVQAMAGEAVTGTPYTLSDLAADGMALLDALDVGAAHVVGCSMGGMIAQTMAIEHHPRVRSLTSVYSTTGEPDVGQPRPDVLAALGTIMVPTEDRAEQVSQGVELARLIGSPSVFDEGRARERTEFFLDRSYDPMGVSRQLVAILASGSRADALPAVTAPTVVVHGDADPLIDISGGLRTHELIEGSDLRVLEGMGHDLPPQYWGALTDAIGTSVAAGESR
ncbi:MAG: alpha/beta fold hydrolase [Microthrixaceae bacterium]